MMVQTNFKTVPWRSEKYRRFVASLVCCVPGCGRTDVQHHHEQEEAHGGMGTKAGDERGTPLCCGHHDERTRTSRDAWTRWNVDPEEVIRRTQALWIRRGGKPLWEESQPRRRRREANY